MRLAGKALKWLGFSLLLLLVAGTIYGQIGLALDAKRAPPRSEMISVDGRAVHLLCVGEGVRTFVLDAGLGGWSIFWWRIQPQLTKLGRVCAFDRPGLGWSEPSSGGHDGLAAADELASIVKAAHIPTPFVYVGHSLGGNFGQIYFGSHPQNVSALVLLDPGDPKDMLEDFHGTRKEAMAAPDCGPLCYAATAAGYLGVTRLAAQAAGKSFGERRAEYCAGLSRPASAKEAAAYFSALPKTAYENIDVAGFGKAPVLVLTSSELRKPEGKETLEDVKTWRAGYLSHLALLAAKSPKGVGPIEIPNSTHTSMVLGQNQANLVVSEIAAFVSRLLPSTVVTEEVNPLLR
jgi:pimeloyl-ACP methyl ester carboxylesterase